VNLDAAALAERFDIYLENRVYQLVKEQSENERRQEEAYGGEETDPNGAHHTTMCSAMSSVERKDTLAVVLRRLG
jgi:hypothetical protein